MLREPVGLKLIVVEEVARIDVLIEGLGELDVGFDPNDELELTAGDPRLDVDVGIEVDGTLPNEAPPEVSGGDSEMPETEDEGDPIGACIADVGSIEESEIGLLNEASDDVGRLLGNEEDPNVVPNAVDSGVEGSGAAVNDVDPALGTELILVLESGALGVNVAVTMIVWPEL
ncbi:hypothetical protein E8E11_010902 [Didymella keratinophila]|nr:hypothetical protein E8E11_010902 [Didymella keratinophila]